MFANIFEGDSNASALKNNIEDLREFSSNDNEIGGGRRYSNKIIKWEY